MATKKKPSPKYVKVYWNAHKKLFSVYRHHDGKWKLNSWTDNIVLRDVEFIVNPAGSKKVKKTGVKNQHAYVKGYPITDVEDNKAYVTDIVVRYNPYVHTAFVAAHNNKPIETADIAYLKAFGSKKAEVKNRIPVIITMKET